MELVFERHRHNPTVHDENCEIYWKEFTKPITAEKAVRKGYILCSVCLPHGIR